MKAEGGIGKAEDAKGRGQRAKSGGQSAERVSEDDMSRGQSV